MHYMSYEIRLMVKIEALAMSFEHDGSKIVLDNTLRYDILFL